MLRGGLFGRAAPFGQRAGWKRGMEEFIDNVTKPGEYPIAGSCSAFFLFFFNFPPSLRPLPPLVDLNLCGEMWSSTHEQIVLCCDDFLLPRFSAFPF
jgi:hypothetical protein